MLSLKRDKAITGGQWHVTIELKVRDERISSPRELRIADSYLAERPLDVGSTIARAMVAEAERLTPASRRKRK